MKKEDEEVTAEFMLAYFEYFFAYYNDMDKWKRVVTFPVYAVIRCLWWSFSSKILKILEKEKKRRTLN